MKFAKALAIYSMYLTKEAFFFCLFTLPICFYIMHIHNTWLYVYNYLNNYLRYLNRFSTLDLSNSLFNLL